MTTQTKQVLRCSVCGLESEFTTIGSTNAFGYPDLDMRPPPMQRSTIFAWVQRCPGCGYCAADVSASCVTPEFIGSEIYKRQLGDELYPELANSFLCKALLDSEKGDLRAATWAHIHAAWVCDDAGLAASARACRKSAAELLVRTEMTGQELCEQSGLSTVILVDLLRRAGERDKALLALGRSTTRSVEKVIMRLLNYQANLLDAGDLKSHLVSEALSSFEA